MSDDPQARVAIVKRVAAVFAVALITAIVPTTPLLWAEEQSEKKTPSGKSDTWGVPRPVSGDVSARRKRTPTTKYDLTKVQSKSNARMGSTNKKMKIKGIVTRRDADTFR